MDTYELCRRIAAEASQDYAADPDNPELRAEARHAARTFYCRHVAAEVDAFGGPDAYRAEMQEREHRRLRYAVKEAEDRLRSYRERRYIQSSCAPPKTHEEILSEGESALAAAQDRLTRFCGVVPAFDDE